jgi:adenylate kinase
LILLLFGPPGCGKGTQAAYLAERFSIPAISTGEMFRDECKAGTPLGKIACELISKGALVGDDIVNGMVANRIARPDCTEGFLLDGYPRTVAQAAHFAGILRERNMPEASIIHLDVPDELLVMRLCSRRQCPELLTREDDKESVIRDRIRAYHDQTGPVLRWYSSAHVHRINGALSPDQVARAVSNAVIESSLSVVH